MFRTDRPAPRRRVGLRRLVFFLVAFVLEPAAAGSRRHQRRSARQFQPGQFESCEICRRLRRLGSGRARAYPADLGKMVEAAAVVGGGRRFLRPGEVGRFPQADLGARHLEEAQPVAECRLVGAADGAGNAARRRRQRPARRRVRGGGACDCRCAAKGDHPSRLGDEFVPDGVVRQGS